MNRSILTLSLLSLLGLAFLPINSTNAEQSADSQQNIWRCEPVLLYDVTGEGTAGPYHLQYSIYNNGMISFARQGGVDPNPTMWTTRIPTQNVREIWDDLVAAGAFELLDQPFSAVCVPMTSVTIFSGSTNAVAHTFNYWVPEGPYGVITRIIETAILDPIG